MIKPEDVLFGTFPGTRIVRSVAMESAELEAIVRERNLFLARALRFPEGVSPNYGIIEDFGALGRANIGNYSAAVVLRHQYAEQARDEILILDEVPHGEYAAIAIQAGRFERKSIVDGLKRAVDVIGTANREILYGQHVLEVYRLNGATSLRVPLLPEPVSH